MRNGKPRSRREWARSQMSFSHLLIIDYKRVVPRVFHNQCIRWHQTDPDTSAISMKSPVLCALAGTQHTAAAQEFRRARSIFERALHVECAVWVSEIAVHIAPRSSRSSTQVTKGRRGFQSGFSSLFCRILAKHPGDPIRLSPVPMDSAGTKM